MSTMYGWTEAGNGMAAWFHSEEAARRFAVACGWDNTEPETTDDGVDPADIMDTPEAPWTLTPSTAAAELGRRGGKVGGKSTSAKKGKAARKNGRRANQERDWAVIMRADGGAEETRTVRAKSPAEARDLAIAETEDWIGDGEYGDDGALVSGYWTLRNARGKEVDSGSVEVSIPADEAALMRAAGADPNCEHDFTAEGEGGCDENPGVWSKGGTTLAFSTHCRHCGLIRREVRYGSQRNPGQADTVSFELPDAEE